MQTKKKVVARNVSRENISSRYPLQQKTVAVIAERKARDLITSSVKKRKNAGIFSRKAGDEIAETLKASYVLPDCETQDKSALEQEPEKKTAQCMSDTIFSPAFHIPKETCGNLADNVDFRHYFKAKDHIDHIDSGTEKSKLNSFGCSTQEDKHEPLANKTESYSSHTLDDNADLLLEFPQVSYNRVSYSADTTICVKENNGLNLSSEVSAIYFAMQQSKMECINEQSHDSVSAEARSEAEDVYEYDDFDPYLFIRNLPDLSTVVPAYRPMLLPKQTRSCPSISLVLDLDETLVHSSLEPCEDFDFTFPVSFNLTEHTVYVRCRPHLKDFLERVSRLFEITIFTASQSIYAGQLLNVIDPKRKLFRNRIYRESCVYVDGNYLKDLSVLGRDLALVAIVDNSPQAFGFQIDNGIPIESWFDDRTDKELLNLLPFLESLVGAEDVRPLIAKKFNIREKVAAAVSFN